MEACEKLEVVHVIIELSMEFSRQGGRKNRNKTTQDIKQLQQEFTEAQNRALEYLDNRKDDRSSVSVESPKSVRFAGTGKPAHVLMNVNDPSQLKFSMMKIKKISPVLLVARFRTCVY